MVMLATRRFVAPLATWQLANIASASVGAGEGNDWDA